MSLALTGQSLVRGKSMSGPRKGTREKLFAQRLAKALDRHPRAPEGYGRNIWVVRELAHKNVNITLESVRKWLNGETMPRRRTMSALATILNISETWLAMGVQPAPAGMNPERFKALETALRQIAEMTDNEDIQRVIDNAINQN